MQKGFDSYRCHMPKAKKKEKHWRGSSARVLSADPQELLANTASTFLFTFFYFPVEVYNGATSMACNVQHTHIYTHSTLADIYVFFRFP